MPSPGNLPRSPRDWDNCGYLPGCLITIVTIGPSLESLIIYIDLVQEEIKELHT